MASLFVPPMLLTTAALLIVFLWNLLIGGFLSFCCRDLLDCAELNNQ